MKIRKDYAVWATVIIAFVVGVWGCIAFAGETVERERAVVSEYQTSEVKTTIKTDDAVTYTYEEITAGLTNAINAKSDYQAGWDASMAKHLADKAAGGTAAQGWIDKLISEYDGYIAGFNEEIAVWTARKEFAESNGADGSTPPPEAKDVLYGE